MKKSKRRLNRSGKSFDFCAHFSFYGAANDFLSQDMQKTQNQYLFSGKPSIKDAIEAQGIPHPEVDLIIVNGASVGFNYHLCDSDVALVNPPLGAFAAESIVSLRTRASDKTRFVVDVNLGKLARQMRMMGFDTLYQNNYQDCEIADISYRSGRTVLTRDRKLLCAKKITFGYWVRSQEAQRQIVEVMKRFNLKELAQPLSRCLTCNGLIEPVKKEKIFDRLETKTERYYNHFYICCDCAQIYWKGSHLEGLRWTIEKALSLKD